MSMRCSVCGFDHKNLVIDFKDIPLCDALKHSKQEAIQVTKYPVEVVNCPSCGHAELIIKPPEEEIYSNYTYRTSLSPTLDEHFDKYSVDLISLYQKTNGEHPELNFLDIGGNDGVLANKLARKGHKTYIVDPSPTALLCDKNITVINNYFDDTQAELLKEEVGQFSLITCNNCLANIRDLTRFAKNASSLLKSNGIICIETGYIKHQIETKTIEMINHEHYHYFSINSLKKLFGQYGVSLCKWEFIKTKGGSIRFWGIKDNGNKNNEQSVQLPNEELNSNSLQEYISLRKKEISNITRGKQISFFGSSAGSTILTYVFGLENQVSEVIDDNESRHGKYMPGTGARVISPSSWYKQDDQVCINFAWRFGGMIKSRHSQNKDNNHRIVDIIESSDKK